VLRWPGASLIRAIAYQELRFAKLAPRRADPVYPILTTKGGNPIRPWKPLY